MKKAKSFIKEDLKLVVKRLESLVSRQDNEIQNLISELVSIRGVNSKLTSHLIKIMSYGGKYV